MQTLARLLTAREHDLVLPRRRDPPRAGSSTPFGMTSYSPGSQRRRRVARVRRDRDPVVQPIGEKPPRPACRAFIHPSVAVSRGTSRRPGTRASASAATQIAGVIGSCRWRTSNARARARAGSRRTDRGERTMFGSDPFAGTITERPTGITSGGGAPCRPSRGCSTRVKLPGRIVAHDRARLEPRAPQRLGLLLGVLDDARPSTTTNTGRRSRPSCQRRGVSR